MHGHKETADPEPIRRAVHLDRRITPKCILKIACASDLRLRVRLTPQVFREPQIAGVGEAACSYRRGARIELLREPARMPLEVSKRQELGADRYIGFRRSILISVDHCKASRRFRSPSREKRIRAAIGLHEQQSSRTYLGSRVKVSG